jgi:hypothetical protein
MQHVQHCQTKCSCRLAGLSRSVWQAAAELLVVLCSADTVHSVTVALPLECLFVRLISTAQQRFANVGKYTGVRPTFAFSFNNPGWQ